MQGSKRIMTGSPLTVKLNGESVFFNYIVSKKRVVQWTNRSHTESMPSVMGESQRLNSDNQQKPKGPDCIYSVVEISHSTGNKGLCNQYLCPAYFRNNFTNCIKAA